MGEEKLDVTTATIRGLYDLADLAERRATGRRALGALARRLDGDRIRGRLVDAQIPQYADSLDDPGDVKKMQRHWIGVTPMEIELFKAGRVSPGLATLGHGNAALDVRERPCYSGDFGLFHTGTSGCDGGPAGTGERSIFTLNTAVMAVGEGNYGRLGTGQQQRFTAANRRLQLPDPDEQPGAMPEIAPSPDLRPLDRQGLLRPRHGAPGVGHLRHALAGRAPAARRAARHGTRSPRGDPAGAGWAVERRRLEHQARRRRRGRLGHPLRQHLQHEGHARRAAVRLHHRPHAPPRRGRRGSHARRPAGRLTKVPSNRGLEVLVSAPTSGTHELVVTAR